MRGISRSKIIRTLRSVTMPATGLKEKTKRAAARSPFENTTTKHAGSDEDIDMDEDVTSDEEDVPEKDEAEKKLERMLFGDDEGFMGALKSQQEQADAMQLTLHSDEESESADEEAEGEDDGDLENMADADVCDLCHVYACNTNCEASILTVRH